MRFAHIELLSVIWVLPVLLAVMVYGMKKRRRIMGAFARSRALAAIAPESPAGRRYLKMGLLTTAMLFIILALTGPQYGYQWQAVERRGIDIILALDCSRSMLAEDVRPTRLARAKREIYDLLARLEGDRIGLVAFAGTAFQQCPLTLDYEAFHLFLNSLTPDYLPVGGTDISRAIATCLDGFDPETATEKAIILITDGENTGSGDPLEAAEKAKTAGIKLFCVGVGNPQGAPVPDEQGGFTKDRAGQIVLSRLDETMLQQTAVLTGGTYVRSVAGDMDLDIIYAREIRGKMAAASVSGGRKKVWEDRYQWLLGIALLALVLEIFLPDRKKTAALLAVGLLLMFAQPVRAGSMQTGLDAYANGEYEKALKHFIEAQLDHPDSPGILYNIGNAYYKLGKFDAARDHYRQVLTSEDPKLRQRALYNLGNTEYRLQSLEPALENYEKALEIDPEDRQARENIDFVKEMMARQQQRPQDSKGDESAENRSEEGDRDTKQQTGGSEDEGPSKKPEPADAGDGRQAQGRGDREKGSSPENGQAPPPPEDENGKAPAQAAPGRAGAEEKQSGPGMAERMLNRLQDHPGRPTAPQYREQRVEKDW